jgi:predicted DNA-binding transcriptional regulator YafY
MAGDYLYLGNYQEQCQERSGQLELRTVRVRFFPPVAAFILKGEQRHPRQHLRGKKSAVDYEIELPPRSLDEFCRWVYRFMYGAKILEPVELADKHYRAALEVVRRYEEG